MKTIKSRTDTIRLDWLEQQEGCALISDDNGHWTVAGDGWQNCPMTKEAIDIQTTFFIEKDKWADSVREAIDQAVNRAMEDTNE